MAPRARRRFTPWIHWSTRLAQPRFMTIAHPGATSLDHLIWPRHRPPVVAGSAERFTRRCRRSHIRRRHGMGRIAQLRHVRPHVTTCRSDKTGGRGEARAHTGAQGLLDDLDHRCARPRRVRDHRADPRPLCRAVRRLRASPSGCCSPRTRSPSWSCAPLLGRLSDRIGRKPVIVISLIGTAVGSFVTGAAGALWVLFAGRIVDGASGGSLSVAQAAVADIAPEEQRPGLLGMLGAAFGIGFVLGPAIGGLAALGGPHVPFYVAGVLASINAIAAMIRLPETRRPTTDRRHSRSTHADIADAAPPGRHRLHHGHRLHCVRGDVLVVR